MISKSSLNHGNGMETFIEAFNGACQAADKKQADKKHFRSL